jgi:hypothetical protein
MARGARLITWDDLPEYPTDDEIGEVVLGFDRRKFHDLATLREREGMPRIDPFWGGRPKLLVRKFIESDQIAVVEPRELGAGGAWHVPKSSSLKKTPGAEPPPKIQKRTPRTPPDTK